MAEPDGGSDGHLVQKCRLKHLITDPAGLSLVQDAVQRMHRITEAAYILGKAAYLQRLDQLLAANDGIFDHTLAAALAAEFPLAEERFEDWLDVVSSDLEKRKGRPLAADKRARMLPLLSLYRGLAQQGALPAVKTPCTHLSYAKGHTAQQMMVAYKNNVHCHFDAYPKRIAALEFARILQASQGLPLTTAQKQEASKQARHAVVRMLEGRDALEGCPVIYHAWLQEHRSKLMPAPPNRPEPHWRFYDQKVHPARWLPYMVMINRWLEEAASPRLLSPLPLRTSFVPAHVRLDTQGMWELLAKDQAAMEAAKAALERQRMGQPVLAAANTSMASGAPPPLYQVPGWLGPRGIAKCQVLGALRGLVHGTLVPLVDSAPQFHAAHYRTSLWRCFTALGSAAAPATCLRRARNAFGTRDGVVEELVFNNVIDTDGVSVSMHYVLPHLYGLTQFNGGKARIKASQQAQQRAQRAAGATYITRLSAEERLAILHGGRPLVAADPGKRDILCLQAGGHTMRYTASQRRRESGQAMHAAKLRRMLAQTLPGSAATVSDVQRSMQGAASRSCVTTAFGLYAQRRQQAQGVLRSFYERTCHRQMRYDAFCGRRASEDRLVSAIQTAYGRDAVLLYGNWGQSPNIQHQPPTPGVGLRRRLASQFTILLVCEKYTSSVCPACDARELQHPRMRASWAAMEGEHMVRPVHHLLKCGNTECCSPWWNRNVLGCLNIGRVARHALAYGTWHPTFA